MNLILSDQTSRQLDVFRQKPAHAVLLTGTVGIGKSFIARQLASDLLNVPVSNENNPYLRIIKPVKDVITIAMIRELSRFFSLSVPGTANVKRVALLIDSDRMGQEAQNALLKLLEEPPVGSVLLLTTSRLNDLLPTIRSRVQLLTIHDPPETALAMHFQAAGYEPLVVSRAIARHGGNIAAINNALYVGEGGDDLLSMARKLLAATRYERLTLVEPVSKQREQAVRLTETIAAMASAGLGTAASHNSKALGRWHAVLSAAETARQALESNGSVKLVMTELMLAI